MHGLAQEATFEEILFRPILFEVGAQIAKKKFWHGKAVFVAFPLHHLQLHGGAVNGIYFKHAQFIETKACTK